MSQQSKLRQSRYQWKQKAKERAEHNRYLRKELARLRKERDHAKQAIKEAKKQLRQKEARLANLKVQRVWLALTLFVGARISFRAVSRVLHVLAEWLGIDKAPCPQTVINWVMRLSIVRMQSVRLLQGAARHLLPFTNGLIWMIDTSITLGTGKLLSVLALDAYHYQLAGCAPGFQHVRCVAVAVSPCWSGERLTALLERVISVVGRPAAYLKDGGSELQKAVDVLSERGLGSPVIDDISHAVATMLKRRYNTHPQFSTFLSACGRVSSQLKHTVLACLSPPKVQTKSRFMNVHRLVRWADGVLGLLPAGRAKAGSVVAKLRACLDDLPACRPLIRQFRDDAVALLACQKMLKTHGLTHDTLTQCEPLLDTMASVRGRQEFSRYLHHHLETAKRLGLEAVGLPISSDPIESLFGLAKQHGVGPLKEANRMALRMPALCGLPTEQEAQQVLALGVAQQHALTAGLSSLTKQRRQMRVNPHHLEQLGHGQDQGNVELIPPGKDRSNRSEIIYLPQGYKVVNGPAERGPKGPLPGRHEVSTTPVTVGVHQVQNPVKSQTPI
jgi:hypothetical protein